MGKPFGAMYSAPAGAPAQAVPTSYTAPPNVTVVKPRPQRAKSAERHTPSGYPTCAFVVCPENDDPRPVTHRTYFASGPQFSAVGIGTLPSHWSCVAPSAVTRFRLRAQLPLIRMEKPEHFTTWMSLVISKP